MSDWTPIKDKLPDGEVKNYLVTCKKGSFLWVTDSLFDAWDNKFYDKATKNDITEEVIAWADMPKPYIEKLNTESEENENGRVIYDEQGLLEGTR